MDRYKPGMTRLPQVIAAGLSLPAAVLPAVEQGRADQGCAAFGPSCPHRAAATGDLPTILHHPPQLIPSPQRGRGTG